MADNQIVKINETNVAICYGKVVAFEQFGNVYVDGQWHKYSTSTTRIINKLSEGYTHYWEIYNIIYKNNHRYIKIKNI